MFKRKKINSVNVNGHDKQKLQNCQLNERMTEIFHISVLHLTKILEDKDRNLIVTQQDTKAMMTKTGHDSPREEL